MAVAKNGKGMPKTDGIGVKSGDVLDFRTVADAPTRAAPSVGKRVSKRIKAGE